MSPLLYKKSILELIKKLTKLKFLHLYFFLTFFAIGVWFSLIYCDIKEALTDQNVKNWANITVQFVIND